MNSSDAARRLPGVSYSRSASLRAISFSFASFSSWPASSAAAFADARRARAVRSSTFASISLSRAVISCVCVGGCTAPTSPSCLLIDVCWARRNFFTSLSDGVPDTPSRYSRLSIPIDRPSGSRPAPPNWVANSDTDPPFFRNSSWRLTRSFRFSSSCRIGAFFAAWSSLRRYSVASFRICLARLSCAFASSASVAARMCAASAASRAAFSSSTRSPSSCGVGRCASVTGWYGGSTPRFAASSNADCDACVLAIARSCSAWRRSSSCSAWRTLACAVAYGAYACR
jgi:hypothetical protein